MTSKNRAAWVKEKQARPMVVDDAPYNVAGKNELVVKVQAVAFNPVDAGIQRMGIIVENYPAILGCDAAGIVEEVGQGEIASQFSRGDRVICFGTPQEAGNRCSTFQLYCIARFPAIAKIPEDMAFADAAVLPLAIFTAYTSLFSKSTLDLQWPLSNRGCGQTMIVWGASSSVGSCGVQQAVAAGYEVFGVASARNHAMVKECGASRTFDQADADLVDQIVHASKGKQLAGAYDAISTALTLESLCKILSRVEGARKRIAAVMPGSENHATDGVEVTTNFGEMGAVDTPLGRHIWREFVEGALKSGALKCMPRPETVGHGLESVQTGCDTIAEGVSAKKIVITI